MDEQLAEPARRRLLRGEVDTFADDIRVTFATATNLVPEMFLWLSARYLEYRSVNGIVEGFERFLASRGLAQAPEPLGPPAIVFVDLSGFTRATPASTVMSPPSAPRPRSNAAPTRRRGVTEDVS